MKKTLITFAFAAVLTSMPLLAQDAGGGGTCPDTGTKSVKPSSVNVGEYDCSWVDRRGTPHLTTCKRSSIYTPPHSDCVGKVPGMECVGPTQKNVIEQKFKCVRRGTAARMGGCQLDGNPTNVDTVDHYTAKKCPKPVPADEQPADPEEGNH